MATITRHRSTGNRNTRKVLGVAARVYPGHTRAGDVVHFTLSLDIPSGENEPAEAYNVTLSTEEAKQVVAFWNARLSA